MAKEATSTSGVSRLPLCDYRLSQWCSIFCGHEQRHAAHTRCPVPSLPSCPAGGSANETVVRFDAVIAAARSAALPASYPSASSLILAAMMKSFSCRPSILWVNSTIEQ